MISAELKSGAALLRLCGIDNYHRPDAAGYRQVSKILELSFAFTETVPLQNRKMAFISVWLEKELATKNEFSISSPRRIWTLLVPLPK